MSSPKSILKAPTPPDCFVGDSTTKQIAKDQKLPRASSASALPRKTSTSKIEDVRNPNGSRIDLSTIKQDDLIHRWCCFSDGPLGLSTAYGLPAFTQADLSQHEATVLKLISALQSQKDEIRLPTLYALADNPTITPAVIQAIANIPDIQQAIIELSSQTDTDTFAEQTRKKQQAKKAASELPAEPRPLSLHEQSEKLKKQIAGCIKGRLSESPKRRVSFNTQQIGLTHYEAYNPKAQKIQRSDSQAELETINEQDLSGTQKPIHSPNYNAYEFPEENGWLASIATVALPVLTHALFGGSRIPLQKFERKTSAPSLHFEPETLQDLVVFAEHAYQTAKQQGTANPAKDPLFLSLKHKIIHHPEFQKIAIETAQRN